MVCRRLDVECLQVTVTYLYEYRWHPSPTEQVSLTLLPPLLCVTALREIKLIKTRLDTMVRASDIGRLAQLKDNPLEKTSDDVQAISEPLPPRGCQARRLPSTSSITRRPLYSESDPFTNSNTHIASAGTAWAMMVQADHFRQYELRRPMLDNDS